MVRRSVIVDNGSLRCTVICLLLDVLKGTLSSERSSMHVVVTCCAIAIEFSPSMSACVFGWSLTDVGVMLFATLLKFALTFDASLSNFLFLIICF